MLSLIHIWSESRGGIVKLPEGDQAKDVTRYTDRIVNHMISHMVKRVRAVSYTHLYGAI